jgi:CRISPR-associated protein Csd2
MNKIDMVVLMDTETLQGLISDVCLKRRIRDYVYMTQRNNPQLDIFIVNDGISLNSKMINVGNETPKNKGDIQSKLINKYWDIRTFGGVLNTGNTNAGQLTGPVQVSIGKSIDPIVEINMSITKSCNTVEDGKEKDSSTMGRKSLIAYGLYKFNVHISPLLAEKTGFTDDDLEILMNAIQNMFEFNRTSSKGLMSVRKIIKFTHNSQLGSLPSHKLLDLVRVNKINPDKSARSFSDYSIEIDKLDNSNVSIDVIE